ncbi:kinesin-like protein KIF18B [Dermacentor silvarum]|uniref:kinesin-like protein KIF18B n=1 Tax=Dermacentor silvarum TaxID=543639 RepID=UPI002100CA71|nr:kinesin-like protein KIF18B [Dermacentor silvarum]
MAVRMRLLSDRDSETTSVVLVVTTPAPVVRPIPATSRHPITEESTMVPTFSMLGSEECPGVVSLMASELYQRVDKLRSEGRTCDVAVSYLEVYNKVVRDLLCFDPTKGIAILYLTIHKVKKAGTLLEPLLKGNNRTQHATDANAESSWSHVIFESYVTLTENATITSKETRVSMCFVDLAGSEREAAASRGTKDQMREVTKFNLSLLALGNCIDVRSKNGTQQVPYQDSKLTHILKDFLGGSGSALMIGTATAVKLSYAETCSTLDAPIEKYKHKVEGLQRKLDNVELWKAVVEADVQELKDGLVA